MPSMDLRRRQGAGPKAPSRWAAVRLPYLRDKTMIYESQADAVVNRWEPTARYVRPGGWEGRVQSAGGVTTVGTCRHVHASRAEAERCAEGLAARLNYKLMPSDYYLG